jgi:conjugal transfer pilus assembly protein TraF
MKLIAQVFVAVAFVAQMASAWSQALEDEPADCPYWKTDCKGWLFYRDPAAVSPRPKAKPTPPDAANALKRAEVIQHDTMNKNLDELRKVAIMNPTPDNMHAYMSYQMMAMNTAAKFADAWQRTVWTDPNLDYAMRGRPTTQFGLESFDAELQRKQRATVAALAKTHGLYFFFRSDCPYCHKFAPVLKRFAQETGMTVFPISLDGPGLPEFPIPTPDNGASQLLQISAVPAVVLAVPGTGEKQVISYGVVADTDLYERIYTLTSVKVGNRF